MSQWCSELGVCPCGVVSLERPKTLLIDHVLRNTARLFAESSNMHEYSALPYSDFVQRFEHKMYFN